MPVLFSATTPAQTVMDNVAQDVRQTLSSTTQPGIATLLNYTDRVCFEMLRTSRWVFLLSSPLKFLTQYGVSNYWLGQENMQPSSTFDTGLNITDLRIVKPKSVIDRSNFRPLGHMDEKPVSAKIAYSDGNARPGRPAVWRQDEDSPNVLNLYPAPDNQNNYSPQPSAAICTTVPGGSLPDRLYFLTATYIDSLGNESTAPWATEIFVPAGRLVVVQPPLEVFEANATGIQYNRYNVYGSSAGPNEQDIIYYANTTLQTPTPISNSVNWTEPTTGLTGTGVNPPSVNNCQPLLGYVIEFRYYKQRIKLVDPSNILQIPDDYIDVVTSGVNALAFAYLSRPSEAMRWYQIYKDGISQIIRDINFMAKGGEYINIDPAAVGSFLQSVETLDLGTLAP